MATSQIKNLTELINQSGIVAIVWKMHQSKQGLLGSWKYVSAIEWVIKDALTTYGTDLHVLLFL
jgi:hypothetical protein